MQRFRKPKWMLFLVLTLTSTQVLAQATSTLPQAEPQQAPLVDEVPDLHDLVDNLDLDLSKSPLTTQEQDVANAITERVKATEWLGALAPVAISPFFGLTCLSGIAIIGEERLPEDHYLRRASTPLRNPLVFVTFLVLTVLTSIPKLSKVSKPFAQAVDQLETYSAIVILLVIRFMGGIDLGPDEPQVVFQAGIVEFSAETLLMLATVVNIIVINTVKFFFEVLVWITPIPFIDAVFETAHKTLCAGLAAVYAFSPTTATIINLFLLACSLLAFSWVKRREVYYRTILFDFVRHWWSPNAMIPLDGKLTVFPKREFDGIKAMARCEISKTDDGWLLRAPRWFRPALERRWPDQAPHIKSGLLMNKLYVGDREFRFGKRFNRQLSEVSARLGAVYDGTESIQRPSGSLATEFA